MTPCSFACRLQGDLLNQFCSSPQSVAQLYLQGKPFTVTFSYESFAPSDHCSPGCELLAGMNLSGTIPSNFLVAMQDLQSFVISDNLNLRGRVPLASATVASRISELRLSNTSLEQCSSSHLTALQNHKGESVVHAGDSSTMAADNLTHCLPNVWQFCGPEGGPVTHITCPSVAFLRPPVTPISNLYKVRHIKTCMVPTLSSTSHRTVRYQGLPWPAFSALCTGTSMTFCRHWYRRLHRHMSVM